MRVWWNIFEPGSRVKLPEADCEPDSYVYGHLNAFSATISLLIWVMSLKLSNRFQPKYSRCLARNYLTAMFCGHRTNAVRTPMTVTTYVASWANNVRICSQNCLVTARLTSQRPGSDNDRPTPKAQRFITQCSYDTNRVTWTRFPPLLHFIKKHIFTIDIYTVLG